jgi:putative nucleotidyltransferase with HDIG domain
MLPDLILPTSSLYIIYALKKAGFEAFLVGGAVRDLMGNSLGYYELKKRLVTGDFDFTTDATPEEIMTIFPDSFYENKFGTVSVPYQKLMAMLAKQLEEEEEFFASPTLPDLEVAKIPIEETTKLHESLTLPTIKTVEELPKNYEITTYRVGEKYEESNRRPSSLSWGKTISDDLNRRDFSVNALAITFDQKWLTKIFQAEKVATQYTVLTKDYTLMDNFGGMQDLKDNLIRAIGEAKKRFEEDPLRLMRAVRLSVQLNFGIDEKTYEAIRESASLIKTVSAERIRDEWWRILGSDYAKEGVMLLNETGLLQYMIPELILMQGVAQSGHHLTDVWIHSLDALAECPSSDPLVRLATLLHDVGKPATQRMLNGKYTFYNHQVIGAYMAKEIAQRLKFSKAQVQRIFILVRYHMFNYEPDHSDASIRRFMRQVGLENLNDILDLREADRLGSNARKTSWRLEEMKKRMIEQLHQPLQVRDLVINGDDLMREFDLKPGPILGRVLKGLLQEVLEDSSLNQKEKLLALAGEMIETER